MGLAERSVGGWLRANSSVDSSSKCNGDDCICSVLPVLDEVEVSLWEEEFSWSFPVEGFSGSGVHFHGDFVELLLAEEAEVLSLGEVLPEQAVGVFVDASLAWAVGMSEVDLDSGLLLEPLAACRFTSLVVGRGAAHGGLEAVEDVGEVLCGGLGTSIVELDQSDEEGGALDQGADAGAVHGALDEIAFPVSGDDALADLLWPVIDECHGVEEGPLVSLGRAGSALGPPAAQ